MDTADAAILAAAIEARKLEDLDDSAAVEATLNSEIAAFLEANTANAGQPEYTITAVNYDPDTRGVELVVDFNFETSFMKLAGIDEIEGKAETAVFINKDTKQPFSMYLVLDRSGSMGSAGKIESLKSAVSAMSSDFEEKDPDHEYIRLGAVAYNHTIAGSVAVDWGSLHVNTFTQSLVAGGGTQAFSALAQAGGALQGTSEDDEHATKNSGDPKKFIVYMTDGADAASAQARAECTTAKNNAIEIYSVAFQAPPAGQQLLQDCASTPDHYFNATNAGDLIAIFQIIGEQAAKELAIAK